MSTLIQFSTAASRYDGPFGGEAGWPAAGMGYLLITDLGRMIAIDGGAAEDAPHFLDLIAAHAGCDIPTVDLWIITHPHLDHYGALDAIARDDTLRARVRIKQLMYHFPDHFRDAKSYGCHSAIRHLSAVLAHTGAAHLMPRIGRTYAVDELRIRMLYTPTDCSILNNPNQLSLIFAVETPARRVLFTGDAFRRNLQITLWRFPDALQADILQMPHHGLCDTGLRAFYEKVSADTLLIPTSLAGSRAMHDGSYGSAPDDNAWAEAHAATIHRACDGTITLNLGGAQ